ncbi:hypothetical protein K504DRAFT_517170 [Pleomassaria siparia CBS 279.74]|uniref:Rhodopsin domain-containing protein n=1 Tax=Pleomassaria siparia CBS 279.74 TaxID=1314801 RepID=A0A6G1KK82_9PLEO|nr:hypothetical protein K504DRAFT_517170 [Pleomassaria siparia CBS 279.74]
MTVLPTAEQMAAWPAPNYVNPQTRRPLVLGIEIPLMILVIIFTAVRFYSRTVIIRALGMDDWFMLAASLILVATNIMTCISTLPAYQTGYHLWDLRPEIATNPVHTSQVCLFTCIFPSRTNKYFCYSLLTFISIWAVAVFFISLFQCSPIQAYWQLAQYPDRKCLDMAPLFYVTGGLNTLTDFLIFLWPAKDLAKIRISLKQRVTLIAMFSLGVIICIAGICRIWYTSIYIASYDIHYEGAVLYIILAIEAGTGIVCGCLPACKPLMTKMMPRTFVSSQESTHKKSMKTGRFPGQAFPFQSLNGGITKEAGFSVQYDDAHDAGGKNTSSVDSQARMDEDNISQGSQDWIMMEDHPKGVAL